MLSLHSPWLGMNPNHSRSLHLQLLWPGPSILLQVIRNVCWKEAGGCKGVRPIQVELGLIPGLPPSSTRSGLAPLQTLVASSQTSSVTCSMVRMLFHSSCRGKA
jgi:hypothetical protein